MIERFRVIYTNDADEFLDGLPQKAKDKILSNIRKSKYVLDPKLVNHQYSVRLVD